MRRSKSLAKIRANQPVRLCSLGHVVPAYIRMAAHHSFDCIWLDTEHRAMTEREVQSLLAQFHLFDIDCLLRVPTREKAKLYRYLEDGATGLMIPHVSSAAEAQQLVDAVKFPPIGDRGLDGAGLDADFYVGDTASYIDQANQETMLIVQIESPRAVEAVSQIAAVEGVDGMFVGTGDLGMRIQRNGADLTVDDALTQVAAAAREHGKAWGCPAGSRDHLSQLREQGAQLIAYGGDFGAMKKMLEKHSAEMTEIYGG